VWAVILLALSLPTYQFSSSLDPIASEEESRGGKETAIIKNFENNAFYMTFSVFAHPFWSDKLFQIVVTRHWHRLIQIALSDTFS
jgi:hypothetical protein